MPLRNLPLTFAPLLLLAQQAAAQPAAARDQQTVSALAASLVALTGGNALTDIRLSANIAYTAGAEADTGSATLEANATAGRLALNLVGGQQLEIRNGLAGQWSTSDSVVHATALHNCWTPANWFVPALFIQNVLKDLTTSVASESVGAPDTSSQLTGAVLSTVVPAQTDDMTAEIRDLSTVHLALDAKTSLPVTLSYNTHPSDDLSVDIPVRIEFSDYQAVSGAQVPFHIRQFIQDTLLLDINVTGAVLNPGLSSADFSVRQ